MSCKRSIIGAYFSVIFRLKVFQGGLGVDEKQAHYLLSFSSFSYYVPISFSPSSNNWTNNNLPSRCELWAFVLSPLCSLWLLQSFHCQVWSVCRGLFDSSSFLLDLVDSPNGFGHIGVSFRRCFCGHKLDQ